MELIFGWTSYLLSVFFQLGKELFQLLQSLCFFGVGMKKEDSEKPVNQAKDDISFSITISGSGLEEGISKVYRRDAQYNG